ncbi:MAG TPA: aroma-sacti cluster domain-containing protein [Streptosporangiaceae bacterium]|nr:aroma-sacti cluster domain-containing protein [Streptosporangiaceae bacterium]
MAFDALAALRAGGTPVDQLSDAQIEVLSGLSPAEVATINSVKARIEAVGDDVEGHSVWGVGVF